MVPPTSSHTRQCTCFPHRLRITLEPCPSDRLKPHSFCRVAIYLGLGMNFLDVLDVFLHPGSSIRVNSQYGRLRSQAGSLRYPAMMLATAVSGMRFESLSSATFAKAPRETGTSRLDRSVRWYGA